MTKQITSFHGQYDFLSNFYMAPVEFEGEMYPSSEHAYQAAKTLNPDERAMIRAAAFPGQAKRMGKRIQLRPDWEQVKLQVMDDILRDKFSRHLDLAQKLLGTGDAELIEGNHWGDRFWGVDGSGMNHLGRLLMIIREELKP